MVRPILCLIGLFGCQSVTDKPEQSGPISGDTSSGPSGSAVDSGSPADDPGTPADDTGSQTEPDTATPDTGADLGDTSDTGPSSDTGDSGDTGESPPPIDLLPSPEVFGEPSAGHATPTWLWSWEYEASEIRWRINDGVWLTADPALGQVTTPEPLTEGDHTVSIEVANSDGLWSSPGTFTTRIEYFERTGYWNGVERDFAQSPLGHWMGVVCHNCYAEDESSPAANLDQTQSILVDAVADEADLLEFDVRYYEGNWRLEHDDTPGSSAVYFEDILAFEPLSDWDQPLFIEVKERDPSPAALQELLQMVLDAGFATNGRPVFFRSFQDVRIDNLHYLRDALDSGDYPLHEPYIRLHVLLKDDSASTTSGFHSLIDEAAASNFQGINLNWQTPDLFNLLEYAKSMELGTSMWTIPESMGEAWCASMREDIDALVVDYDLSDCRQVVEEDTNLLYLNAARMGSGLELEWYGADSSIETATLGGDGAPSTISRAYGGGLFGQSLLFNRGLETSLRLYDADNDPGSGFFLATTVEFDDLDLDSDEKQAIFSKADDGAFALELRGGLLYTSLRFSVHIDGSYRYAERSLLGLDTSKSHFIMAAYDGEGRVRLWLNNSDSWVDESAVYSTGVTLNDSPVRLGADPEGSEATRYHFSGRIQMAMLQKWRDH